MPLSEEYKKTLIGIVRETIDEVGAEEMVRQCGGRSPADAFINAMKEVDASGNVTAAYEANRDEVSQILNGMLGLM